MKCPACGTGNSPSSPRCMKCESPLKREGFLGFTRREIFFYSVVGSITAVLLITFAAVCLWIIAAK